MQLFFAFFLLSEVGFHFFGGCLAKVLNGRGLRYFRVVAVIRDAVGENFRDALNAIQTVVKVEVTFLEAFDCFVVFHDSKIAKERSSTRIFLRFSKDFLIRKSLTASLPSILSATLSPIFEKPERGAGDARRGVVFCSLYFNFLHPTTLLFLFSSLIFYASLRET